MNKLDMLMNQLGMNAGLAGQLKPSIDPEIVAQYKAQMMADPTGAMSAMARLPRNSSGVAIRSQVLNDPEIVSAYRKAMGSTSGSVPPAMMGIDEDMGVLNELMPGISGAVMPSVSSPNAVYDPKTGEYLGDYEFMPQNGLLYR